MFKNKIALKLTAYFAACLVVFSVIISGIFMVLFRNHIIEIQKNDMQQRAVSIAEKLSEFIANGQTSGHGMGMGMGGFGAYLTFLDEIAMTDIWVIDENHNLITTGRRYGSRLTYKDLPANADVVIDEVFSGKTAFSENFSELLQTPTLTVGTPIKYGTNVIGVVLLHSPVEGTNTAVKQGLATLGISITAALFIAVLLAVAFSVTFTKPLNKMKNTALRLAQGDYKVKNQIHQNDEIGELADTMDVLTDRLDEASRQSQKLEQMRRDFIANISHELRTPVTVMRGSLEALVDEVVTEPEQIKDYHRQMLGESVYLQRLVGDLLDLSRLQNNDFEIEMQEINFCDIVDDAVRSAQHIAARKNVNLKLQKMPTLCTFYGDYARLRQMLLVVLDNAIKFSPEQGTVEVTLNEQILTIRDYGSGIAQDILPYIFDRFYKSRSEQNKTGTGLGLAIAKQIAERHHIKLTAQNAQGGGACFQFVLSE